MNGQQKHLPSGRKMALRGHHQAGSKPADKQNQPQTQKYSLTERHYVLHYPVETKSEPHNPW
jgi:hypothetical protein